MKKHLISIAMAFFLKNWHGEGEGNAAALGFSALVGSADRLESLSLVPDSKCTEPLRVDLALCSLLKYPLRNHQTGALQVAGRNSRGFILPSPAHCPSIATIPLSPCLKQRPRGKSFVLPGYQRGAGHVSKIP